MAAQVTQAIHDACESANAAALRIALASAGADPNAVEEEQRLYYPPMHTLIRCINNDAEARAACARILLDAGASANAYQYCLRSRESGRRINLSSALQEAATRGLVGIVEALLNANADVNARGCLGATALHGAAGKAHLECVTLLLARGADVSIHGSKLGDSLRRASSTALACAIRNQSGPAAPRIRRIIPMILRAGGWRDFPLEDVLNRMGINWPEPGRGHWLPPTDAFFRRIDYLERIVAAGGWPNYERNHSAALVATFAPKLPHRLPPELVAHVIAFWAHLGCY